MLLVKFPRNCVACLESYRFCSRVICSNYSTKSNNRRCSLRSRLSSEFGLSGTISSVENSSSALKKEIGRHIEPVRCLNTTAAVEMDGSLVIERVPCLKDNYSWLLHDVETGLTAVVDPAEEKPVVAALQKNGWSLSHVLNTHHHWDHTGANLALKEKYQACIVGPKADQERIPGIDVALQDGDTYALGKSHMICYDTPGHTKGHITLYFPDSRALFPGDTLFSLGCGRLFEGTPAQMWHSLSKLMVLPEDVKVYCAHEYTLSNAKFATHIDPENKALQQKTAEVEEARSKVCL